MHHHHHQHHLSIESGQQSIKIIIVKMTTESLSINIAYVQY